jgi:arylsulfatase A-like enzyme
MEWPKFAGMNPHARLLIRIIILSLAMKAELALSQDRPNIILLFADDLSAREFPVYGSNVWTRPGGGNTSSMSYRARTPVLDGIANEGCYIKTAWAAAICSPSRAMMMTGRYAHLHKWWQNADLGKTSSGAVWAFYESSPHGIATVAKKGGYATFWAGKTQMKGNDVLLYGFDEGCLAPGEQGAPNNPYTDFKLVNQWVSGVKTLVNLDTGDPVDSYAQSGWYWKPHVRLMNLPGAVADLVWWPYNAAAKDSFGLNTYGPDVEQAFAFEFMERMHGKGKPFFIYHTSHLGHDGWDFLNPYDGNMWPGTPKITWTGNGYSRATPNITGDKGVYDLHGTVTGPGIHHHVNYLDYQVWRYLRKLEELGIEDNTVLIFCADNGTWSYGKGHQDLQKGNHVPMIIYAPGLGFTKQGEQDILVDLADILPTIAEIAGVKIPDSYEVNGISLWPYLTTVKSWHRDWIYAYLGPSQLIRGHSVLLDGNNSWWDVSADPEDLISFTRISDWSRVSPEHRAERDRLLSLLPAFDNYDTEHDPPGDWRTIVHEPLSLVVEATAVGISEDSLVLSKNHSYQLIATLHPPDASYQECLWTSSDSTVAFPGRMGEVHAISEGTALITAQEVRSGLYARTKVTVKNVPVTGIKLSPDTVHLFVNRNFILHVLVEPSNASNDSIEWRSTDPTVVTVDRQGRGRTTGPGSAAVIVTSRDGNLSDTAYFTVTEPYIPVTGVSLYPDSLELILGDSYLLKFFVFPDTATNDTLVWSSSDPSVARVSEDGRLTSMGGGLTTIMIRSADNGHIDSTIVSVIDPAAGKESFRGSVDRIFPNPATDHLTIPGDISGPDVTEGTIYNLTGKPVRHFYVKPDPDRQGTAFRISLAGLEPGIYILGLKKGKEIIHHRFLKL